MLILIILYYNNKYDLFDKFDYRKIDFNPYFSLINLINRLFILNIIFGFLISLKIFVF
jgi:hypothetical protein